MEKYIRLQLLSLPHQFRYKLFISIPQDVTDSIQLIGAIKYFGSY